MRRNIKSSTHQLQNMKNTFELVVNWYHGVHNTATTNFYINMFPTLMKHFVRFPQSHGNNSIKEICVFSVFWSTPEFFRMLNATHFKPREHINQILWTVYTRVRGQKYTLRYGLQNVKNNSEQNNAPERMWVFYNDCQQTLCDRHTKFYREKRNVLCSRVQADMYSRCIDHCTSQPSYTPPYSDFPPSCYIYDTMPPTHGTDRWGKLVLSI